MELKKKDVRVFGSKYKNEGGQSTLEYALLLIAFMAVFIGVAAIWSRFSDGLGVDNATDNAPYSVSAKGDSHGYALVF